MAECRLRKVTYVTVPLYAVWSRGTSMRSGPSSVSTVLALFPLRWLPASSGRAAPRRVVQVVRELSAQGALDEHLKERHRGRVFGIAG